MNRIFKQTLLGIVLVFLFSGAPSIAVAADIVFDFETAPDSDDGDGVNPVFSKDGLTITHSTSLAFAVAQWTNDGRSIPFAGTGSMRLSWASVGNPAVSARVDFSFPVSAVSLQALDFNGSANFTISALSTTNTVLATHTVTAVGVYELVDFSGIGNIAALSLSADQVNVAYWDDLTVTPEGESVWAVDASTDSLYKIDLGTGNTTLIGPLHPDPGRFTTPVSMAVRPLDGVIFVNNNSPAGDDGLATVDPATGLATLVNAGGGPGGSYIDAAMAFDDLGNLYAADSTGALAMVDQDTGAANALGGPVLPRLFGLDFNPADNKLYGITGSAAALQLLKIDPATGALLSTIALNKALGGTTAGTLLFDSAGTLHGTTNGPSLNLFEIDPSNGNVSNIRSVTQGFVPQGMGLIIDTVKVTVQVETGNNVTIDPGFLTAVAETVLQAGSIDFELCIAVVDHHVGKWFIPLSTYSNTGTCGDLPNNVFLPPGFKPLIAEDGLRKLAVIIGDSTVLFEGLITEFQDMESVLGFNPDCAMDRPRALGVSDLDVANWLLKLQTTECNRPRSARSSYSTTVFPLTFTGNGKVLAFARLAKIKAELKQATCIAEPVLTELRRQANRIGRKLWRRRFAAAQKGYIDFALIAQDNPGAFVSCPAERNFRGLLTSGGIIGAFVVSEEIRGEVFRIPPEINLPGSPPPIP
jgi:hypothetical protein